MKKRLYLISAVLQLSTLTVFAQFSKSQVEELTALGIAGAIESDNSAITNKATEITADLEDRNEIEKLCSVFDHVYSHWNYQRDPGGMEYFEKAGVSVYTYTGDCDDYAVLIVSLIESYGGQGRVVCVSGHAYPEILIGKNMAVSEIEIVRKQINSYYEDKGSKRRVKYLNYHKGPGNTVWLNLDYQQRFPGGSFYEYSPDAEHLVIYSDGSYEIAYLNK